MLIQLAIIGMIAGMLPLAIVGVSNDPDKYRKLVWITLFLTFDLIMFGAFTRLTDSGLGCPDWPGGYGQADPLRAHADISAAETAMPTGPVTAMKAWIEMIHRYLAMAIGVLIISIMAIAWRKWRQSKETRFAPWFATALFGFICLQGAFGAWTVTMKLQPVIVTTHLLLGLSLPALLAATLLATQIALGGWVSSNYAALACTDFPLCQGTLLPPMDFTHGFTLWRDLGKTASGEFLPFAALTAIHWTHRLFAFAVIALVAWLALKARTIDGLEKTARWLLAGIALQFTTGFLTVFLNFPLALAMLNYKVRLAR